MFALLTQRRLRWRGHVRRMDDGVSPSISFTASSHGSSPAERPVLRYNEASKRDTRAGNIDRAGWAQ